MTKRLLVTGINGFVGGHIQSLSSTMLAKQGYELVTPNTELNLLDERSVEAFVDGAHAEACIRQEIQDPIHQHLRRYIAAVG